MTYEYLCTSCGYQWEAEQPISASPLRDCPKCAQATAKRQVSGGTGFLLKGGGWYADGYGSKGASKPAEGTADKVSSSTEGTGKATPAEQPAKTESPAKSPDKPKSNAPTSS